MLKSGSDFREFSELTVSFNSNTLNTPTARPSVHVVRHDITSKIEPDEEVAKIVDRYLEKLKTGLQEVIGHTDCALEGRFTQLRTRECNLGNLITDIMKKATRADVALLNSGTMRSDTVHDAGEFRMEVCLHCGM